MNAAAARLTLYVAGESPASRRARANLAAALAALGVTLKVRTVDVLAEPDEALAQRIYVTPALVVHVNGQREMLVGDLSQEDAVYMALASLTPDAPGSERTTA